MKKDGSLPARQGITTVYEFNDLLNELWHTIPPGKGRKSLAIVQRVLHKRICNQQNSDCWLCQSRYCAEIEVMLGKSDLLQPEEVQEAPSRAFDIKHWLNDAINANMRARHLRQTPPHSFEVLRAIHDEIARRSSHAVDCIFCLAEAVDHSVPDLSDKQTDSLTGFRPMIDWQDSTDEADDVT